MADARDLMQEILNTDNVSIAESLNVVVEGFQLVFQGDISGLLVAAIGLIPALTVFAIVYYLMRFALDMTIMKGADNHIYSKGIAAGIGLGALFQNAVFVFIWGFMSGSFIILLALVALIFVAAILLKRMNTHALHASADEYRANAGKYDARVENMNSKSGFQSAKKDYLKDNPNLATQIMDRFKKEDREEAAITNDELKEKTIDNTVIEPDINKEKAEQDTLDKITQTMEQEASQATQFAEQAKQGSQEAANNLQRIKTDIAQKANQEEQIDNAETAQLKQEEQALKQEENIIKDEEKHVAKELKEVKKLTGSTQLSPQQKQLAEKQKQDLIHLMKDLKTEENVVKAEEVKDKKQLKLLAEIRALMRKLQKLVLQGNLMQSRDSKELMDLLVEVERRERKLDVELRTKLDEHNQYKQVKRAIFNLHSAIEVELKQEEQNLGR